MSTERDSDALREAFRAIARDDADDADRSGGRIGLLLMAEFQRARPPRRQGLGARMAGLAIAATLVGAVATSVWLAANPGRFTSPRRSTLQAGATVEITTPFMPLAYGGVPFTDGRLVRLEVPRTALRAFGLAPADVDLSPTDPVFADVVVGEDGLARAVRFVRAPRAQGVAP